MHFRGGFLLRIRKEEFVFGYQGLFNYLLGSEKRANQDSDTLKKLAIKVPKPGWEPQ